MPAAGGGLRPQILVRVMLCAGGMCDVRLSKAQCLQGIHHDGITVFFLWLILVFNDYCVIINATNCIMVICKLAAWKLAPGFTDS